MKRSTLLAIVLLSSAVPASDAAAWEAETRLAMTDEAVRFMPTSLRIALERYRKDLLGGALQPLTAEGSAPHRPPWFEGSLDRQVERAAADIVAGVEQAVSFDELARRFGTLAHYVADAGFPPGAAGAGGADHYAHFAQFCESRRERFRLVFLGHGELETGESGFAALTLAALERARHEDGELARAYAKAGTPPDPSHFDDRSVPFAVGSLAYSHSVNDIVRAWLTVWKAAGGDMGRTPYLEQPPAGVE